MANAGTDENRAKSIIGTSNAGDGAIVQVWADPSTHRLLVDANVSSATVTGSLTNNNAAPAANNVGVLPAIANAAAQSWTEGRQVLLSTDLTGALRTTGTFSLSANQSVNIAQIGGTSTVLGSGTSTGALRVELPTNGTGTVGLIAGVAEIGNVKNSGTFATQASLQAIDSNTAIGTVAISSTTNTVVLGAGTAGIGKLTANSGVDIGDVDVTSVIAGVGATNLGKAEDAVAGAGDTGVAVWGVRNETLTAPTNTDGDYSQLSLGSAGEVVVQQAPLTAHVSGVTTMTGTADTSLIPSQGASTYFYCTAFNVVNTSTTTSTLITFKDGNAGATLWYGLAPANGGIVQDGGGKPLFKTSAATMLAVAAASASTTIYVSASGFKSKV